MSEAVLRRSTVATRAAGLLADVLMLALFLVFGVAALGILIEAVVLVVGIVQQVQGASRASLLSSPRFREDIAAMGKALAIAGAAGAAYWAYARARRRLMAGFVDSGFENLVSRRYLIARDGGRLVGLITVVSVLGVAVGVMALIVVISVMEGFDRTLVKKFMGIFSHVEVIPAAGLAKSDRIPREDAEAMMDRLRKVEGVLGVAPIINHQTLVQAKAGVGESKAFANIRGVDPMLEKDVTEFFDYVIAGKTGGPEIPGKQLKRGVSAGLLADKEVVMGNQIARKLGVRVGDKIYAIGNPIATANMTTVKTTQMTVVGIFQSGLFEVDDKFIYTTIPTIQRLTLNESYSAIHLRVADPQETEKYEKAILGSLKYGYGFYTWKQLSPDLFAALWVEKVAMFIILLLIVLVAALNIIGTLVMTVVQKTRDIGILKSMGAPSGAVLRIFLTHGFLIGLVGTSLGTAWGLRLCYFVANDIEKIFELPSAVYGIDRLPVVVEPLAISLMAGCALAICIVASIIPAMQAARLDPVEALRYEG